MLMFYVTNAGILMLQVSGEKGLHISGSNVNEMHRNEGPMRRCSHDRIYFGVTLNNPIN